ncbi:hypothetical protein ABTY98_10705 [Streptomyces sp. NPDC096040]|uniref:hypothetical protein n=1 Tax=Streptomyces sp. NPDC096040 TaxID=3155541 RepID=UPI00331F3AE3
MLARTTDLVALTVADWLDDTIEALGLRTFPVPLDLAPLDFGMARHPRNSADPGHRWFRDRLAAAVTPPAGAVPASAEAVTAPAEGGSRHGRLGPPSGRGPVVCSSDAGGRPSSA